MCIRDRHRIPADHSHHHGHAPARRRLRRPDGNPARRLGRLALLSPQRSTDGDSVETAFSLGNDRFHHLVLVYRILLPLSIGKCEKFGFYCKLLVINGYYFGVFVESLTISHALNRESIRWLCGFNRKHKFRSREQAQTLFHILEVLSIRWKFVHKLSKY